MSGIRAQQARSDGSWVMFLRHVAMAVVTALLVFGFWSTRMEWTADMRLWRAIGDAAIVLLFAALALGPAARLSARVGKALSWRRPLGIWAALAALIHSVLIIDGWAQWSVQRFLGFEYLPQLGREVRLEPGFGLANLIGLVAVIWMTVLLATSSDRAVRYLGPAGWKWVQSGAYIVFYLSVLHSGYFLFLHYTASFHRAVPDPNWFRFPLLALGAIVVVLQWWAFTRSVRQHRSRLTQRAA
ncbi:MAG: ferric reductase-like transmembrane domain-containing protein [Actinomycetales bacterium]|tara:strand:+ start:5632 stop:6357 length:726 start_codon:yes stop_codon:yes gene_type:complete